MVATQVSAVADWERTDAKPKGGRVTAQGDPQRRWRLRRVVGQAAQRVADWAARIPNGGSKPALRPLTAGFMADQHQAYVDHLNAALGDDGVRNIALTGRYGAGKSSVLEEFARQNRKRVLFLSLSSLGPENPNESRTNQIQKELVKQLLHREKPARLPQSRYQRIDRLPLHRALAESAAGLTTLGVVLWLSGVFPHFPELTGNAPLWVRVAAGTLAGAAAVGVTAWIRLAVHNRLEVAQVSAAGTSITLAKKSESYFDRYLDEIVYFFESRRSIDVVVFEDLDRFNQAGIFEALRELNTLLNNSKQITAHPFWRTGKRTIRFVYAIRDSIFEQLGHDTKKLDNDAAQAEAVRANRTKFFDLVIPLVPFITHRTSRELLAKVLNDDGLAAVPPVSDDLVDLAARHLPDMRLLTNIRNEYSVFAKRLITEQHGMDTLTANQLFALVVYKNLHLEDFELLQLGRSKLDTVYRLSRILVTENISSCRTRLRQITDSLALQRAVKEQATTWGQKLDWFFSKVAEGTPNGSITAYVIDDTEHDTGDALTPDFWREALEAHSGISAVVISRSYSQRKRVKLEMDELQDIVSDGLRATDWTNAPQDQLKQQQEDVLAELEALRTADFVDLAKRPDFTLNHDGTARTFRSLVADNIDSELGQALIADGYIDRYYNMYVAQYYGERVPPNAMSYIVQNVDTNRPDINYPFDDSTEIAALLKETKGSFLADVSAYNIDIVDYLLETCDNGAHTVLDNVTRNLGETERAFLNAYLSEGTQANKAVAYLATRWPAIFTELVETAELPHDDRVQLVDVALANSSARVDYQLGDTVRQFLQDNYKAFHTVAQPEDAVDSVVEVTFDDEALTDGAIANAVTTLQRARFQCDDHAALRQTAMRPVVKADCYVLTAANLRTALDEPATLSLDRVRSLDPDIYEDALARPDQYLQAIDTENEPTGPDTSPDQHLTNWTVEDPATFSTIVSDLADLRTQHSVGIIRLANPDCIIDDLTAVPSSTWEALAECRRFPATLGNVDAYIQYLGEIDADLATVLTAAEAIAVPEPSEEAVEDTGTPGKATEATEGDTSSEADGVETAKVRVAEAVLNGSAAIPDPPTRAQLAGSLNMKAWFPVIRVPAEQGQLLGQIIGERICNDTAATFSHFNTSDWPTLSYGIKQSAKFGKFVTPELLNPSITKLLLDSSDISADLKSTILGRFDEFIPADNKATLAAAGRAALATSFNPGAARITTIAQGTGDGDLVVRLVYHFRDELTTGEVLAAVLQAGEPYRRLTTAGEKLTFARDNHHEAVLQRLKAGGRINSRAYAKSLMKEARIEVEVL